MIVRRDKAAHSTDEGEERQVAPLARPVCGSPVLNEAWVVIAVHTQGGHLPVSPKGSLKRISLFLRWASWLTEEIVKIPWRDRWCRVYGKVRQAL
jgi:hypothetical protein